MAHFDLNQERTALWQDLLQVAQCSPLDAAAFEQALCALRAVDRFWAYPGVQVLDQLAHYLHSEQHALLAQLARNAHSQLHSGSWQRQVFSPFQSTLEKLDRPHLLDPGQLQAAPQQTRKPYFEVLVVHPLPGDYAPLYRQQLSAFTTAHDEFVFDMVMVDSAEDALNAVLANSSIQAVVYLQHVAPATAASSPAFARHTQALLAGAPPWQPHAGVEVNLCRSVRALRPELDHYLISEQAALDVLPQVRQHFDRVLFHHNPFQDLHAAILAGVRCRYSTPFFDALQAYSRSPKSVFHALPLSRGASLKDSPWAHDLLDFYGDNIFLAETSSTQGGLDSLLDPTGAIKQAHNKAALSFGADATYFVTNGTSTSNKIVMQAHVRPGDIVLIGADCHKSVPYAVMLAGAYPVFLETYALPDYDLHGAVALQQIKDVMLELKAHGKLHLLRMVTLTNSTFDGLVYNAEAFMMELLAIKPDLIFHWDEAWFAFGHFHPLYHCRTAMGAVRSIRARMHDAHYHQFYAQWKANFAVSCDPAKWQQTLYPDPAQVCLRVYATQSTHKTLTAFRQASMVHVADDAFAAAAFLEAFRIHTSTSPNYQIIASLDMARRQAALEGFHKVGETLRLSMQLRQRIRTAPDLQPWFTVLEAQQLVAPGLGSDAAGACDPHADTHADTHPASLSALRAQWGGAALVVDPTRVTLDIRATGMDGTALRQLLMTRYDIQVNKTSRHTVLFLINIGASQASIDYLLQVLHEIAARFQFERRQRSVASTVDSTAEPVPLCLQARVFHPAYVPFAALPVPLSDTRRAYFDGLNEAHVMHVPLSGASLAQLEAGAQWVSAGFVTPYPPGFPVLMPGQVITADIFHHLQTLKIREVHGFHPESGFRVLHPDYLNSIHPTSYPTSQPISHGATP
jgi:arginine decarboxylase